MVLTIDLVPELESQLYAAAAQRGVAPREYVVETLREHLLPVKTEAWGLSATESQLFEEINRGLSESEWSRYRELIRRRREEQLTVDEQAELIAITDHLERLNVRRRELLANLARVRNTSLPRLMEQLGLQAAPVF